MSRACVTCNLTGPLSLCSPLIKPHFASSYAMPSCDVRDNCGKGVDKWSQLPPQVAKRLNLSSHRVEWDESMEQVLLDAARAGTDISPRDYPHAQRELRLLLRRFRASGVAGGRALVGGSISPWVEATLVAAGAAAVVTRDYQARLGEGVHRSALTTFAHADQLRAASFDVAVSFSSIEHDGLGRCAPLSPRTVPAEVIAPALTFLTRPRPSRFVAADCDPINADGDLAAMAEFHRWLKPGGLLFLGVPLGPTEPALVAGGNRHRIYGWQRWRQLMRGFELVHSPYPNESAWPRGPAAARLAVMGAGIQPVQVLRRRDLAHHQPQACSGCSYSVFQYGCVR